MENIFISVPASSQHKAGPTGIAHAC